MNFLLDLMRACTKGEWVLVKNEKNSSDVVFLTIIEVAEKCFEKPFVREFVYHMFYLLHSNVSVWVSMNHCAIKSLVNLLENVEMSSVCDVCKTILMITNNDSASRREKWLVVDAMILTEEPVYAAILSWMQQDLSDRVLVEFGQILIVLASYRRGWVGA